MEKLSDDFHDKLNCIMISGNDNFETLKKDAESQRIFIAEQIELL